MNFKDYLVAAKEGNMKEMLPGQKDTVPLTRKGERVWEAPLIVTERLIKWFRCFALWGKHREFKMRRQYSAQ